MIGIRNDTNRLVFFCCIMTLWNAFGLCAPLEDGTNRPLCKLTVPTNARASILRPRESSSKSQSENDFECDKKVFSLNDVTINQKWMILLECEPGYSLIGKQLLTCTQDSYGTSVWDGMSPACVANACFWFGNQNDHVEFSYNGQLLSSLTTGFPNGTELIFRDSVCPLGQSLDKNSPKLKCNNGHWTGVHYSNCIIEPNSCLWAGPRRNVEFQFEHKVLNNTLERYPEGTLAIDSDQNVTCPFGNAFQRNSVLTCRNGSWSLLTHPCVSDLTEQHDALAYYSHIVVVFEAFMLLFIVACLVFFIRKQYCSASPEHANNGAQQIYSKVIPKSKRKEQLLTASCG